ncbi:cholesterol 25-hydroxylase-like protein 2 [Erpetoichthys calabaricus]|uniref:cholesterol 25-hydroxylase-like protein 2 n=1 Tax=Erpetoichthys calabaricus TaxID=27687 RepID=UPI0010A089A9|nr:cholesterol 25-hydroxylase-like protein 2 [Erpetoichthys calabaricus]
MEFLFCYSQAIHMANMTSYIPGKSVLQLFWDYLLTNFQDTLRSPLFPIILSVSTYFLLVTLFTILDVLAYILPGINQYKIHSKKQVTLNEILKTLGLTVYNHLVFIFPATVAQWYWRPPVPLPKEAPSLLEFVFGILGCTILFDFQYYLWHMLHHKIKWLYTTFHAIHHEFYEPFSLVTQYLSAWELICVGFWTTVDPIFFQCHCLTAWSFMVFNVWISIDDHCGYDFPWSMHNLIPFGLWGGSIKHYAHHQKPSTNFAPFFSHWDWLAGTGSGWEHSAALTTRLKKKS